MKKEDEKLEWVAKGKSFFHRCCKQRMIKQVCYKILKCGIHRIRWDVRYVCKCCGDVVVPDWEDRCI